MSALRAAALALLLLAPAGCATHDIVVASPASVARHESVLVLPGLGFAHENKKDMRAFATKLAAEGYDVYVPDYIRRKGLDASVGSLGEFIRRKRLDRAPKLHVFAYIMGGVTFDLYLEKNALPNLGSVLYDRSPLQERAPVIVTTHLPIVGRILFGQVIFDLAKARYPTLSRSDIPIGILVENRATPFLRKHRKQALAMSPLSFDEEALAQPHTAICYVWLHHLEMYHRFDVLEPEVLSFLREGHFRESARTAPFDRDPFE